MPGVFMRSVKSLNLGFKRGQVQLVTRNLRCSGHPVVARCRFHLSLAWTLISPDFFQDVSKRRESAAITFSCLERS